MEPTLDQRIIQKQANQIANLSYSVTSLEAQKEMLEAEVASLRDQLTRAKASTEGPKEKLKGSPAE